MLELLIAAAIIGTLAIFAMQSFRSSAADVRVEEAKMRAQVVSVAAYRFLLDHGNATISSDDSTATAVAEANRSRCSASAFSLQNLIDCGYLEYRQYAAEERGDTTHSGDDNFESNFTMTFERGSSNTATGKVCVQGRTAKITNYDSRAYCYKNGVQEN